MEGRIEILCGGPVGGGIVGRPTIGHHGWSMVGAGPVG